MVTNFKMDEEHTTGENIFGNTFVGNVIFREVMLKSEFVFFLFCLYVPGSRVAKTIIWIIMLNFYQFLGCCKR